LEDPGVNGRMIPKWIFKRLGVGCTSLEQGQVAGFCECGNEPSVFIKSGECLSASQEGICSME